MDFGVIDEQTVWEHGQGENLWVRKATLDRHCHFALRVPVCLKGGLEKEVTVAFKDASQ